MMAVDEGDMEDVQGLLERLHGMSRRSVGGNSTGLDGSFLSDTHSHSTPFDLPN